MRAEGFFCSLSEDTLKIFESMKITGSYAKGARLFVEGQPADGVYMLCQGRVKLSMCSKDGKLIILHIAEPGEVLGLSATVSDTNHFKTAEALESCQVNFVNSRDFRRFLEQNAEAGVKATRHLSRKYNSACVQIHTLGLSASVADKLATLLLGWCDSSDVQATFINLKILHTHEEIAQMIGTSRETVTRLLKSFRDRKLIGGKCSELNIPDKEKLAASIGTRHKAKARS
jgi:CRP/FNR family transcriptional regulator, cyclic AMP receptor protein